MTSLFGSMIEVDLCGAVLLLSERGPYVTTIAHPHIELRADGTAFLEGTQTKVIELVLDRLAYNWDADELQRQHPDLAVAMRRTAVSRALPPAHIAKRGVVSWKSS